MLATIRSFPSRLMMAVAFAVAVSGYASAQRDLTDIPTPDPDAELEQMRLSDAVAVNLFSSDPDISKPIQMNFDSTGGLWVASSEVYPQIAPGEVANDKIIVLRDTNGDGVADKRTVFADGLLIPTGVLPDGPHAAYVAESTRLIYLEDTDGDDVADKRRVVLSGFGTEDTHHLVHTLRFGPDGCVYFNQSIYIHSHIETPFGTRHLDGGGIWRYRPSTGRLEVVCKGFVNPWGHVFDSVGESFATDGAYFEGINYVFPDSVFVTSPGASRWLKGLNPGSPKHCGLEILSGTHVPPDWSGDLVANDFRSHRVCRFTIKPSGSSYISRQQPEIITTKHVAFRPIDAKMGPDGALYIADWYNPIIQHGEVDFRDQRRDRTHGRIWRVTFPGRELDFWPDFSALDIESLIALLEDPSLQVRQFARQQLWQRASQSSERVRTAFDAWAAGASRQRQLERHWIYEVMEQTTGEDFRETLASVDPAARRTMIRSLWRQRDELGAQKMPGLERVVLDWTGDEDPRVRLEAVVCAGQLGDDSQADSEVRVEAFQAVLTAAQQTLDSNLDFAIWQSLRRLDAGYANGSILSAIDWQADPRQLAFAVSAIANPQAAEIAVKLVEQNRIPDDAISPIIDSIAMSADSGQLGRTVRALIKLDQTNLSLERFKPLLDRTLRDKTVPSEVGGALAEIADEKILGDPKRLQTLARLAAVWKLADLEPVIVGAIDDAPASIQVTLIESLGSFDSQVAKEKLDLLSQAPELPIRVAAVRAMVVRRPQAAVVPIVELLEHQESVDAAAGMIVAMLNRKAASELIAKAIAQRELNADLARGLLRAVRSKGGNPSLEQAIRVAGRLENAAWKLTPELQTRILDAAATAGSASRGEVIYRREKLQCIQCHAIGNAGGLVGPNLISLGGSSPPDYVLESLLAPSNKLKEGYTTLSLLTEDGEVINGIVIGRDEEVIRLRLADGKEVQIDIDSVEQEKPGKSLMPEGLLDSLTQAELVDLVTFLTSLGREPEYTVSTEPLVRSLQMLVYSDEANRRLNRTSTDTAATEDPSMNWKMLTSKVDGTIPLAELDRFKQHRQTPPTSFIRFQVDMPADGVAKIQVPVEGLQSWVDSKPTPVSDLASQPLTAGTHQIVLAIDHDQCLHPFAIRLGGDAK